METCHLIGEVFIKDKKYDVFEFADECGFTDLEIGPALDEETEKVLLLIAGQIELSATSGIIEDAMWTFNRFETPIKQE